MLSSAKLGHTLQPMPIIPDAARKFSDFLKDELAAAAIEYIALSAGIAVAVLTAVKPANLSPACRILRLSHALCERNLEVSSSS